jgi:hypothetical protein
MRLIWAPASGVQEDVLGGVMCAPNGTSGIALPVGTASVV